MYACWAQYEFSYFGIGLNAVIFIFCFALTFVQHLLLITGTDENSALQRYDIINRNATESNFETVNYLEIVICVVSDRCQLLLFLLKI